MEHNKRSTAIESSPAFTREFKGLPISVIPHDEDLWVTAEAIGTALEYPDPRKSVQKVFERNRDELLPHSCVVKLTTQGQDGPPQGRATRVFNEEGVMIITMLSRQQKAKEFRRWAVGVLKAFRRGGLAVTELRDREHMHRLCLKEVSKGNVAAMDTLIQHFGYRPEFKDEQLIALAVLRGRPSGQMQMALNGDRGDV